MISTGELGDQDLSFYSCGALCAALISENKKAEDGASALFTILYIYLVGVRGFEPPTTCTPYRCATRLRYTPFVDRRISATTKAYITRI